MYCTLVKYGFWSLLAWYGYVVFSLTKQILNVDVWDSNNAIEERFVRYLIGKTLLLFGTLSIGIAILA